MSSKEHNVAQSRPFEGIKVVDFSWSIVGPLATKYLADYGATVIKIESVHYPDMARRMAPYVGGKSGLERAATFAMYNTSKYSMALNLSHSEAVEVTKELIAWSDVLVETFRPGVMERLGLGWQIIRDIQPSIIMVRASLQGQTGPHRMQPGYGTMMQALTGLVHVTGWSDRPPVGFSVPIADFIGGYYLTIALIAALDYRSRTGKGQYIDLGEFEATATCLAPSILDYTVNGHIQQRDGNRSIHAAPHGVFRCKGDNRWCAIAVFSDSQWEALKQAIGKPDWADDPKFGTFRKRKQNEDELEKLIETWTAERTAEEVMAELQAARVPAGVLANGKDLCEDAHLEHRHYFEWIEHPVIGKCAVNSYPFKFSRIYYHMKRSPLLGEHTEWVCREILKMSDERFIQLLQEGVFE
jgi:benzylsuccinate CoA-transferase BbsF subunit